MNSNKARLRLPRLPPIGLSDLKASAGSRLGQFCLFCYVELPRTKAKPRLRCDSHECFKAYERAYLVDYRRDVFQLPYKPDA